MSDDPRADSSNEESQIQSQTTGRIRRFAKPATICGIAVALWCLVWQSAAKLSPGESVRHAILASAVFAAVCATVRWHERRWAGPARKLRETLIQIRSGEAPIELLDAITGPLAAVAEQSRMIFQDIRTCEKSVAELNAEMSQRVAGRTDALERVIGSLRQQATRDALTGLFNRRLLDQQLPDLIDRCCADGSDLAILMIDVDHFKHLNDTLGHAAGDELLRDIAQIIRSSIRPEDTAYRCGGDEFVITMPGAQNELVDGTCARLKSLVEGLTRPLKVITPPRLSIGISHLSGLSDATPERLLREADSMLYRLKHAGKKAARVKSVARAG